MKNNSIDPNRQVTTVGDRPHARSSPYLVLVLALAMLPFGLTACSKPEPKKVTAEAKTDDDQKSLDNRNERRKSKLRREADTP